MRGVRRVGAQGVVRRVGVGLRVGGRDGLRVRVCGAVPNRERAQRVLRAVSGTHGHARGRHSVVAARGLPQPRQVRMQTRYAFARPHRVHRRRKPRVTPPHCGFSKHRARGGGGAYGVEGGVHAGPHQGGLRFSPPQGLHIRPHVVMEQVLPQPDRDSVCQGVRKLGDGGRLGREKGGSGRHPQHCIRHRNRHGARPEARIRKTLLIDQRRSLGRRGGPRRRNQRPHWRRVRQQRHRRCHPLWLRGRLIRLA
mmetsp:Transcript_37224/g.119663  ORF Transcript_37224/g.119663 Transcript_37224/m.119663 type:complete len:252 (+) Transcript_37224:430-1185(+)